ncbi:cbb3-type cytochrome c oxidase N-terminal domain-containing protein [Mesohalobacter halotolerans]|uniref:C-type cytochrome n=1 Tax=Mesohalobacter halotolerans TaxID=1883405 RepID=A0A4U5TQM4_9FLAO|nr:cbb3-type cytochrome c oxidase N-terminal domain-containing protein [Mesohalobacter halotolerans]MBS3737674.1 c-type cytochrome [Psychroflexus sp.]TKS56510.1 c-type cytochrome [Mesohalobacter halotolerans]
MRTTASYLRVIALVVIAIIGTEYFTDLPKGEYAIFEKPFAALFVFMVLIVAIAIEVTVAALHKILYLSLSEDKKEAFDKAQAKKSTYFSRQVERLMQAMTKSKKIEEEHEIELDHNYDGIRELDNRLPPWWVYSFYLTIIFAAVYLVRFHIFNDYDQEEEYLTEVAEAEVAIEEWKENAKDFVNAENVTMLEDEARLQNGEQIYVQNCVACHKVDGGGGIGPNLTDEHWILGGGIKNVFRTISEGGRSGKGMVAWKNNLSPAEMHEVASYVMTFQGTTPSDPKEPQGEIWKPENEE